MDPFHVVRLAGDALDRCRRRIQQTIHVHRGRASDPLYRARPTLHTGIDLLTDKQQQRLKAVFADDNHVQVEATWGIYRRMIAASRQPDRARGRALMVKLIASLHHGVPKPLTELITLGRTLTPRAADVLAHFDRPGASNGPTEAINGRSNISAAPPSGSAISPTTSPDAYRSRRIQTPTTPSILITCAALVPMKYRLPRETLSNLYSLFGKRAGNWVLRVG